MHLSSLTPLGRSDVVVPAAAGAALTLAAALACRGPLSRSGRRPQRRAASAAAAGAGVVVAPVTVVALVASGNAPDGLVVALAVLVAGGAVAEGLRRRVARSPGREPARAGLAVAALVPGAAALAWWPPAGVPGPQWVHALVAATVLAASPALWSFDRRRGRLTPVLLVVSVAAVYATTPDTEQVLVLLGAAAGVAVVAWWPALPLGTLAAPVVAGLVAWVVAVDGRGRESAVVGGLACLGLLVAEPAAALLRRRRGSALDILPAAWAVAAAVSAQVAVAGVASRVAGLRRTPTGALAVAGPLLVVAVAALAIGPGRRRRDAGPPGNHPP